MRSARHPLCFTTIYAGASVGCPVDVRRTSSGCPLGVHGTFSDSFWMSKRACAKSGKEQEHGLA